MINIAICDDETVMIEIFHNAICDLFAKEKVKCNIDTYTDGNLLLEDNKSKVFHVLFLDIDMPAISGLEVADQLRSKNPHINIIFVTHREDLVFQAIKYKPFRFIRKSHFAEELPETVHALMHQFHNVSRYYKFETKNSVANIKISSILYFESRKHEIFIYCKDNEYCVRGTMNSFEEIFKPKGFIRIHSGYLVNFRYIFSVNKENILLDNQKTLPLSRRRVLDVKQKIQLFSRSVEL